MQRSRFQLPAPPNDSIDGVSFGRWAHSVMKARSPKAQEAFATDSKGPGMIKEEAVKLLLRCHRKSWAGYLPVEEQRDHVEKGLQVIEKASMSELSGGVGGYLVPYEWAYGMLRDVAEDSVFWSRAFVQPMGSETLMLPFPAPDTSIGINEVTNLLGGMRMFWKSTQSAGMTESDPQFENIQLNAQDLAGYQVASNQLAMDFPGLDAFLRQLCTRAIEWYSDQAFFQGVGTGQPLGIVNGPGSLLVTRNVANAVAQVDVANMWEQLLPQAKKRAVWAMSPTAAQNLLNLTGLGGLLYLIPGEDGSEGLLYGRPIYETEKLPSIGTTGDVCLFDPSLYAVGYRGLWIDFSDQAPAQFQQYQSVWRTVCRLDGTPMLRKYMTLANQSSTLAAGYVVLH